MANLAETQKTIYLKDYQKPDFQINQTHLTFTLGEEGTEVNSQLNITRAEGVKPDQPLVLNAEAMEVLAVAIDGEPLAADQWQHSDNLSLIHISEPTRPY